MDNKQGYVIVNNVKDFFQETNMVLREVYLPQLNSSDVSMLQRPFKKDEIKLATFSLEEDKSPGPDGITTEFFKSHWNTVGHDIVKAVQSFFNLGFLLQAWNNTLLVILHNVSPPT